MKVVQLIEYNMKNASAEKSYTKCGGETIPRPISKKSKLSISLSQSSKVSCSLFLFYSKLTAIEEIFLLLYSINWSNFIVWLPLLREILGNMWIVSVC